MNYMFAFQLRYMNEQIWSPLNNECSTINNGAVETYSENHKKDQ